MTRRQRVPRSRFPAVAIALALGTTLLIAGSNSTSLSNGAQLAVSITSPTTGDEFEVPPGIPTINVGVTGSASVGLGEPDASFIYIMDTSGSTGAGSGTGCSPILNCEKQFFVALNNAVAADGSTDEAGFITFDDAAHIHDMQTAAGFQNFTLPSDPNVASVINASVTGGVTNCTDALNKALTLVAASSNSVNNVVFASDGLCNSGGSLAGAAAALAGTGAIVNSIAVGSGSNCTSNGGTGTLNQIAANGGQCYQVPDPGDLPDLISNLIGSTLQSLSKQIDGGGFAGIPNGNISLPLPQPGAVSVNYTESADSLAPGDHTVCVKANGSDVLGGTANVTQCETIHLLQLSATPATATNDLTVDSSHTVTATIAGDPGQVAGRLVNFVVGGHNAGAAGACNTAGCLTDAAGQVSFTYSVPVAPASIGTDAIAVSSLIGGNHSTVTVQKIWADLTPPVSACTPSVNPSGGNIPKASKTNEDGFFVGTAIDVVDPNAKVYVIDLGTGTTFGPFASGVHIKYTQAPGVTPKIEPMSGAVQWHIWGKGDLQVKGVDGSGNASTANCFVPPLPK